MNDDDDDDEQRQLHSEHNDSTPAAVSCSLT